MKKSHIMSYLNSHNKYINVSNSSHIYGETMNNRVVYGNRPNIDIRRTYVEKQSVPSSSPYYVGNVSQKSRDFVSGFHTYTVGP